MYGHEVLRDLDLGAVLGLRRGLRDRAGQVEALPLREQLEQRRVRAEGHQRVDARHLAVDRPGAAHARRHLRGDLGERGQARDHLRRGREARGRLGRHRHAAFGERDHRAARVVAGALRREPVGEAQLQRRVRIRERRRDHDVGRHRPRLAHQAAERGQQVLVVLGPQVAPRAERRLDVRQHVAVGEEAVEPDVDLVRRRRDVGDQALHQRAPDLRDRVDPRAS
jgi:hypothetical protein